MHDDDLNRIFRSLDEPAAPDLAFGEGLYSELRAEVNDRSHRTRRGSGAFAPLAAAAVVIAAIGLGVAAGTGFVRLPWVVGDASQSPAPSQSADETPSSSLEANPSQLPAESADPSAAPTSSPGLANPPIPVDSMVRTTVDALTIRTDPGTSSESLGFLAAGAVSFVVAGPISADGYDWYLLSGLGLPVATGCGPDSGGTEPYTCPVWFGWSAAADPAGSAWLETTEPEPACVEPPPSELMELHLARTAIQLMSCYGSRELSLRAWWPEPTDPAWNCDTESDVEWLGCPNTVLGWDPGYPEAIGVAVDPAGGPSFPERGQWVRITAHYDDPEAIRCGSTADATTQDLRRILHCRTQLVVTAVEIAPAP